MGCCEHGDEPSGSMKDGEFLDQLSDCFLLKKNSAHGISWPRINVKVVLAIKTTEGHPLNPLLLLGETGLRHMTAGHSISVCFPAKDRDFYLFHPVQTCPGAKPVSSPVSTADSFLERGTVGVWC
jgi:hypothetical protein